MSEAAIGGALQELRRAALIGLAFGAGALHLAVVGVLLMLHRRWIVVDTLSLGQATLLVIGGGAGAMTAASIAGAGRGRRLALSLLAGAAAGVPIAALTVVMALVSMRDIFISLSPELFEMLSLGFDPATAAALLIAGGAGAGLLGAALRMSPRIIIRAILPGAIAVLIAGVFQELIQLMLQQYGDVIGQIRDLVYSWEGLGQSGAVIVFITVALLSEAVGFVRRLLLARTPVPDHRRDRMVRAALALLVLVLLPALAGSYIGQVLMTVGLYILMGMGLNIEVGLAGLLDLGFVAFFAVGAYTTALLTSEGPHALIHVSYWLAMPTSVVMAIVVGVLFGLPVLGVRGDYLAVATMGLGEIVRVIVQSDFAAPLLGGAQGVLEIPKPRLGGFVLGSPVALFYVTLIAAGVAAFVAWRLENSRLGRAWMALRDDEDVAQALGINLIRSKLLAYGLGAGFAGLAGSIFATMLTSVYPSSFQLLISINVLALIIVGGMGSLPGVVLGAIALIGLPELLREFGEYRYLFYGAVLIVMMRLRPEGLWPSDIRQRELHAADETIALDAGTEPLPVAPQ
jgi:branched-chain amino acid transport system permease protein